MVMIGVTGQDDPNELDKSTGEHMTPDYQPCPVTLLCRHLSDVLRWASKEY